MKKFLLILVALTIPFSVKGIVNPTNVFYVNDYANILSPKIEEYILEKSLRLSKKDGTQFVVLTIPNLQGMDISKYGDSYFEENGIGKKSSGNGLLMLILLKEKATYIKVGDGLDWIFPFGRAGDLMDEFMIPYLKRDSYDKGVENGYNSLYTEIVNMKHLDIPYKNSQHVYSKEEKNELLEGCKNMFMMIFGLCLASIISRLLCKGKYLLSFVIMIAYIGLAFLVKFPFMFMFVVLVYTIFDCAFKKINMIQLEEALKHPENFRRLRK